MSTLSQRHLSVKDSLGGRIVKLVGFINGLLIIKLRDKEIPVTVEQWSLMAALYFNPGLSQAEVADRTRKDKTNITRIIDLLERDKFVKRMNHPTDRRSYRLYLTERGKKTAELIFPIIEEVNCICLGGVNSQSLENFTKVLDQIESNALSVL
jgi:DNA-binding MarR family transcriptional regulator